MCLDRKKLRVLGEQVEIGFHPDQPTGIRGDSLKKTILKVTSEGWEVGSTCSWAREVDSGPRSGEGLAKA